MNGSNPEENKIDEWGRGKDTGRGNSELLSENSKGWIIYESESRRMEDERSVEEEIRGCNGRCGAGEGEGGKGEEGKEGGRKETEETKEIMQVKRIKIYIRVDAYQNMCVCACVYACLRILQE